MTDTAGTTGDHPVTAALSSIATALDQVADAVLRTLDDPTTREVLVELSRTTARLAELEARVAAHAETTGAARVAGATSTANLWAHTARMTRPDAHRKVRLATALDAHPLTRAAMAAGAVLPDQAHVITDSVDALPETVDQDVRRQAETVLVEKAAEFDARHLRTLGHEAALLAKEEARAAKATSFTLTRDGHGTAHGKFTLPEAQAAMREKALRSIAAPKHQRAVHGAGSYEHRPSPERMGQALCEYVERYPTDALPEAGGVNATVVVTMTLDTLLGGLAAATSDDRAARSPWATSESRSPVTRLEGLSPGLDSGSLRSPGSTTGGYYLTRQPLPRPPRPRLGPRQTHRPHQRPAPLPLPPPPSPPRDRHPAADVRSHRHQVADTGRPSGLVGGSPAQHAHHPVEHTVGGLEVGPRSVGEQQRSELLAALLQLGDEVAATGGGGDEHRAAIGVVRFAGHEAVGHQTIDQAGHVARTDLESSRQPGLAARSVLPEQPQQVDPGRRRPALDHETFLVLLHEHGHLEQPVEDASGSDGGHVVMIVHHVSSST